MNDIWYTPNFVTDGNYKDVGPFIQAMRKSECLTQRDVSEATGFSVQTISRFENGRSNPTTVAAAYIIDYVLTHADVSPEEAIILYSEFTSLGSINSVSIMDS